MGKIKLLFGASILLFMSTHASAFPISFLPVFEDSSGRGWLDNYIGLSNSWLDFAERCNILTGACSGEIETNFHGTFNLDGVYWASRDEVREMLYDVTHIPQGALDDYEATFDRSLGYAANFFDYRYDEEGERQRTFGSMASQGGGNRGVAGHYLRDPVVQDGELTAAYAQISGCFSSEFTNYPDSGGLPCPENELFPPSLDRFILTGGISIDFADPQIGTFLYRRVSAVPAPPAIWLFGIGLIGLVGFTKRRKAA